MAANVNLGGTSATVKLTGNDSITADQTISFPDTGGNTRDVVVTPGTADIETTGSLTVSQGGDFGSVVGVNRTVGSTACFAGSLNGTQTSLIQADGSITAGTGNNQIGFFPNEPRQAIVDPAGGTRYVFEIYAGGGTAANKRLAINNDGAIRLGGSNVNGNPNLLLAETGNIDSKGVITSSRFGSVGIASLCTNISGTEYPIAVYNSSSAIQFSVDKSGNVVSAGTITPSSVVFNLESDNPDAWEKKTEEVTETIEVEVPVVKKPGVGTADLVDGDERETRTVSKEVTRTVETQVYVGKSLDVRQTLESLLERAAAQDAVIADLTRQITELKGANS